MKVLIPVDGSTHALAAVRFALRLATAGARLQCTLLHVQEPAYLYELLLAPAPQALDRLTDRAGQEATRDARALLEAHAAAYELSIVSGDPAQRILEQAAARASDFIVLGDRGRGAIAGLVLGSVSSKVLQLAPIPVTVVRSAGAAQPDPQAARARRDP